MKNRLTIGKNYQNKSGAGDWHMLYPLALRYQDLSPESLQVDLEFIDHALKLVFINE
jgi:hypothetical protein